MRRFLLSIGSLFALFSGLGVSACKSELLLSGSALEESRPSISTPDTLFAEPGDRVSIKGKNLSAEISLLINGQSTELIILDSENAEFVVPKIPEVDRYRLSFNLANQTLNSFSLAKTSAIGSLPIIPVSLEFICDDLVFKDQTGAVVRGGAKCGSSTMKACDEDGEVHCEANGIFRAANTVDISRKVAAGETVAGISGSAPVKPSDCSADGESLCVVDGVGFKAAKLSFFSAGDMRSTARCAGIQGSLTPCNSDGELGCFVMGPSFGAADLSGAAAKIISGRSLAGIQGAARPAPTNCALDNDTNCIATSAFPAVVKANVSAGLLKSGTIIAGVTGAYPSATYPLASNTATADLTMFQSQLTANGAFEFFDSTGARFTGSGDSDLVPANIRSGTAIEGLSLNGIMPAILPVAPTTLTATFFTSPDRMAVDWTAAPGAAGYVLIARPGASVTFTPAQNQSYTAGFQGPDIILYVGTNLNFTHNGILSGNSYNYAVYSYDANHFYSSAPTRAINTSLFCQGLTGGSWVAVPGDPTYVTNDFCVHKYEAKDVGGVATSQPTLSPWANISQTSAVAACRMLGSNYDLISNAEWLTIGANIAQTASNWSSGTVGLGSINRGHSDSNPNLACSASSDDTLAWVQTDCTPKDSAGDIWTQKRTHTLSNGGTLWDFAGNVSEWTTYVISNLNAKPYASTDGGPVFSFRNFNNLDSSLTVMTRGELVLTNAQKSFWNDAWSSTAGIGQYYGGPNGSGGTLKRGGVWSQTSYSGIFGASIAHPNTYPTSDTGFRCVVRPPTL
jgi:hypothetical protein